MSIDVDPLHGASWRQQLAIVAAISRSVTKASEQTCGPQMHLPIGLLAPRHLALHPERASALILRGIESELLAVRLEALASLLASIAQGVLVSRALSSAHKSPSAARFLPSRVFPAFCRDTNLASNSPVVKGEESAAKSCTLRP